MIDDSQQCDSKFYKSVEDRFDELEEKHQGITGLAMLQFTVNMNRIMKKLAEEIGVRPSDVTSEQIIDFTLPTLIEALEAKRS